MLPSLKSVPGSFHLEANGELLYRLCIALVERNLVDEKLWLAAGKIPIVFARNVIRMLVDQPGVLKNIEYGLEICDEPDSGYGSRAGLLPSALLAMFELQTAGFLVIGEAIKALDFEEQNLGPAFYVVLVHSLWRWMRVYDHSAAAWHCEQLVEMMEQDDPEGRESYEFPDVEKAVPPRVKEVDGWELQAARRLLRKHRDGPFADWIERLFRIVRLSRLAKVTVSVEESYDSPPVPSLLVVFRENDAIHACWDDEAAHYYESSNEPTCALRFRPDHPAEFEAALRTAFVFLKLNVEVSDLANMLNDWEEKQHASRDQHREEPPLRAA